MAFSLLLGWGFNSFAVAFWRCFIVMVVSILAFVVVSYCCDWGVGSGHLAFWGGFWMLTRTKFVCFLAASGRRTLAYSPKDSLTSTMNS